MKTLAVAVLMLGTVACATVPQDEPTPAAAPVAAPDPRIGEMQTSMTELLERIDVLNERIARVEEDRVPAAAPAAAAVPQPAPAEATPAAPVAAPAQPQSALVGAKLADDYRQAIILFGRGRHGEARRGFQAVFDSDPAGDLADNALFWIGETYFAAGDYTNATRFYNRVVNEFSEENKAPDALFKIALAQERTGDLSLARKTLQQVIERYPYSSPASSAKAELQRIRF
jgi:tol-pal system protein YbgF